MASEQDQEKMTDQYSRDRILNFMIAGKDTTAGTLSWFFYLLCKNPLIQEKIATEIREAVETHEEKPLVGDFAENLTEAALDKMHNGCHFSGQNGKRSASDDVLPDGFKVRKGDGINYVPYAMGRMTYIWGEGAKDFKPERSLKNGVF